MGSREGVANKIEADTQIKLKEMLQTLGASKEPVIEAVLKIVYEINADLHKNYRDEQ